MDVLTGRTQAELEELLGPSSGPAPLPPYRAAQIFRWISRGARSFEAMTDLPRELRAALGERFSLSSVEAAARLREPGDETEKLTLRLRDGLGIEAVLLSDGAGRKTACLSSQAGCPMGCVFCKTGSLGFRRNLEAAEIVEQFLRLRDGPGDAPRDISRIVVMGMGEPLLNLGELRQALAVLTSPGGCGISKRHITISTCGMAEGIRDLAEHGPRVGLALSLTTADEALRRRLMPVSAVHPLTELKKALRYYQAREGRRITLEMVLLEGINTRKADAEALEDFVRGLETVVNLIPWNAVEGLSFERAPLRSPGSGELAAFTGELARRGIKATMRRRKGSRIGGACGQLAGDLGAGSYSLQSAGRIATPPKRS